MKLGVDLGGTKIEIMALDDAGNILHRQRTATPKDNYEEIITAISNLVSSAEAKLKQLGTVGICTPGVIEAEGSPNEGLLKNSNTECLNGKPFKQDLEKSLNREIAIANDANCFALSEATDGAAKGANNVFGVIIGTGTGAGIIVNGQVLNGANSIAGEWGHNPLPWKNADEQLGPPCYCGRHGCIETFLSGTGFARNFYLKHDRKMTAEQIVLGAAEGNEACEQAMQTYEDQMARGLSHVINILDPDVIVLGGGMSNIERLYQNVPKLWQQYIFSDHVNTKLLPPMHGDSSGVRGAAWLT